MYDKVFLGCTMVESNDTDLQIRKLETIAEKDFDFDHPNVKVMQAIREELGRAGMSRSWRDKLVATCDININVDLSAKQLERLLTAVRKLTRRFFEAHRAMEFTDEAIAQMGRYFTIHMENL